MSQPQQMNDLMVIEPINALTVFSEGGLDPLIERIEREARAQAVDISTPKGRKDVASLAHKIAKSKTALDKAGKDLVADKKAEIKKVDMERARAWDRLEALQKEIRKPLTEWEEKDAKRIQAHENDLTEISELGQAAMENWQTLDVQIMKDSLAHLGNYKPDWQEFEARAQDTIAAASKMFSTAIERREKYDAEQAELARLRREDEERKKREHEERIAKEAAEKARLEAEAKAKAEAEKAEAERLRVEKAKQEADAAAEKAEREKQAAIEQAKKAEEARIESENRAKEEAVQREAEYKIRQEADAKAEEQRRKEQAEAAERQRLADVKAAEEKAEREKQAAINAERERVAKEKAAADAEQAKREANKKHRAKINNEALNALAPFIALAAPSMPGTMVDDIAKEIVKAIAAGSVANVTIKY